MFGGDGLRSPGARLAWLAPLPWFSELHVGVQNANEGETTPSFLGDETVGGRPVVKTDVGSMKDLLYLTRWKNAWNWSDSLTTLLGVLRPLRPERHRRRRPHVHLRRRHGLEVAAARPLPRLAVRHLADRGDAARLRRRPLRAAPRDESGDTDVSGDTLHDWGLYTQLLWGFHSVGRRSPLRVRERQRAEQDGGRQADFLRDDRHRVAPLIVWQPSEFSRIRLQYDFDHAEFLLRRRTPTACGWAIEVLYGAHPAHQY